VVIVVNIVVIIIFVAVFVAVFAAVVFAVVVVVVFSEKTCVLIVVVACDDYRLSHDVMTPSTILAT
jgi:uncharacterized membrane protein